MIDSEHNHLNLSGLRTRRDILEVLWRQGLSGRALLKEHTQLIDSHLETKFTKCLEAGEGMALVAIGGYGRSELFPFSDIDLLLLHSPPDPSSSLNAVAEAIFYPLWDAGLEVGHSVRTVDQCLSDADNDFFFQIALLDARFVAGSNSLFAQLQKQFQNKFIEGQRKKFLEQMTCHRNERHRRFGKHSYLLEPQVKESRGGLRDIQALLWTAKVIFGLKNLASVKEAGLISAKEHQLFEQAWEHLIKIRNRLHYISSRKNDQLYFEHQKEIAKAFQYRSTKGIMDVEHFMREVHNHLQTITVTVDLFFEHVDEVINKPSSKIKKEDIQLLENGILIRKERIHLADPKSLKSNPEQLIRVFAHSAQSSLPIHHHTRKQIAANLQLINDEFRISPQASQSFLYILTQDNGSLVALETMLECGVLATYIPEFLHLKSLGQHDVYHVYTVDHHLIQTVAILHRLKEKHANIFSLLCTPHILFLAGLLHDIGKGYGGNHSIKGAELCRQISKRLGLSSSEQTLLAFSVENHLFLTDTALRRDLEDANLIKNCAEKIESIEQLAILFLLSIADAKATGPTVWNDWKAALLLDLYLKIALFLEKTGAGQQNLSMGVDWIRESVNSILTEENPLDLTILPDDYLLSFSPEEIADHLRQSKSITDSDLIISTKDRKSSWSLLIMTADRPGLLTKICGVIALNNFEVLAANIFTWPNGIVVDSLDIRPIFADPITEQIWNTLKTDMKMAVNYRLGLEYRLSRKNVPAKKSTVSPQPAKVVIDNNTSETYTIIEVYTENQTGIMYNITRVLTDFQINIFRAKIGTRSDQIVDVFYVLDYYGQKIREKSFIEEIRQSLLFAASI